MAIDRSQPVISELPVPPQAVSTPLAAGRVHPDLFGGYDPHDPRDQLEWCQDMERLIWHQGKAWINHMRWVALLKIMHPVSKTAKVGGWCVAGASITMFLKHGNTPSITHIGVLFLVLGVLGAVPRLLEQRLAELDPQTQRILSIEGAFEEANCERLLTLNTVRAAAQTHDKRISLPSIAEPLAVEMVAAKLLEGAVTLVGAAEATAAALFAVSLKYFRFSTPPEVI